jgi:hypothetical protein
MAKNIRVTHPTNDPADGPLPATFAAFGVAAVNYTRVVGILTSRSDPHIEFVETAHKAVKDKHFWVIHFRDIPDDDYVLEVFSNGDLSLAEDTVNFITVASGSVHHSPPNIQYPTPNTTVCPGFCAYGTADNSITGGDMNGAPGVVLESGRSWAIQFSGLAASPPNYTLTVTDATPAASASTPLTVKVSHVCFL